MKKRKRSLTVNPFVSKAQESACFAKDDPAWDCEEWAAATPKGKKLPRRKGKKVTANAKKNPLRYDPSRTATLRRALIAAMRKRFARLKLAVWKLLVDEDALGLRQPVAPLVGNQAAEHHGTLDWEERRQLGMSRASLPLIDVPDVRQSNHWTCGAAATFCVAQWFGVGATTLAQTIRILGTNVEHSTHPLAIVRYLRSLGLRVEARAGLSIRDLAGYHARGLPVICPVQDYGNRREPGALWPYGHYLTVIGVGMGGRVFCQDSSLENVERVPGGDVPKSEQEDSDNIAEPGRIMVLPQDWLRVWHDRDLEGVPYVHFGIAVGAPATANAATHNTRWKFTSDPEKIKAFQAWLKAEFGKDLTSPDAEELWRRYAEAGFRKGAGRAFDDTRSASRVLAAGDQTRTDFYAGTRDEFLRSAFGQPETVEKIQLLAGRSFDDLENVTADMSARMSRTLTDGLVQGKNPRDIARDMSEDIDISRKRAELIASTEIIRAHAEGTLDSLERLGVEEVGAAIEWLATDDERVCPRCEAMEGVVLKIDEARGLIPAHPGCRCTWTPANVGESDEGQKDTKRDIDAALADADIDDVSVSTARPQSILNRLRDLLANDGDNCGIGPGGFQPGNTCAKGGGGKTKQDFSLKTKQSLEAAGHLSAEQRQLFQASSNYVLKNMTDQASARLHANTTQVNFHPSVDAVGQTLAARSSKLAEELSKGARVNGAYSPKSGEIHLDGGGTQAGEKLHAAEIYAHEYGHVIDGKVGAKISDGGEWRSAWAKEASGLSRYATTSPAEGFAEFSRAVHTGKASKTDLQDRFPGMSAVWVGEGLL